MSRKTRRPVVVEHSFCVSINTTYESLFEKAFKDSDSIKEIREKLSINKNLSIEKGLGKK